MASARTGVSDRPMVFISQKLADSAASIHRKKATTRGGHCEIMADYHPAWIRPSAAAQNQRLPS